MAITLAMYRLMRENRQHLKYGGTLLEIGEANWYGDAPAEMLLEDAPNHQIEEQIRTANREQSLFGLAKAAYANIFEPSIIEAIDIHGTPSAMKQDLNSVVTLPRRYDVVINNGTLEHVFNIRQGFETMHYATKLGGIMIHDTPFHGWIDHGFFTLQPTLFYDLAHANSYEILCMAVTSLFCNDIERIQSREQCHELNDVPENAQLFVMMRKVSDGPFRVPIQGVYDGRLSPAGVKAWEERR